MTGHTLPELTDFFSQCQWPGEPVTLRDGLIVTNYPEFVTQTVKAVKKGGKYAGEHLKRLQELRIRILYCKKINETA